MLEISIIMALLNTTVLHCLNKWKWIEWFSLHRKPWMPSSDCWLCLSFWLGAIELPFVWYEWYYFLVPVCAAAITNWLVNAALLNDYNR